MRLTAALLLGILLSGCGAQAAKDEEAAKDTYVCLMRGERLVIRFESAEARMLMPSGDRVTLYQLASTSGVRFSNGNLELRGKGMELTLVENGALTPLEGCQPYLAPK